MQSVNPQLYADRVKIINMRDGTQATGNVVDRAVAGRVVPINSKTDKLMARIAITIVCGGLLYGAWALGQPLYWRLYATVINPFVHDPAHGVTA